MTFSVSAEDAEGFANDYCRVQDMAGLMTDSEEAKLNDILDELSIRSFRNHKYHRRILAPFFHPVYSSMAEKPSMLYIRCGF